jgi:hypothetical protein
MDGWMELSREFLMINSVTEDVYSLLRKSKSIVTPIIAIWSRLFCKERLCTGKIAYR